MQRQMVQFRFGQPIEAFDPPRAPKSVTNAMKANRIRINETGIDNREAGVDPRVFAFYQIVVLYLL